MRHTVGGAHSEVTLLAAIVSSRVSALNRGWLAMNTVAPAFHGAKKQLQACFAQPGEETFRWMSPGMQAEHIHGRSDGRSDTTGANAARAWASRSCRR